MATSRKNKTKKTTKKKEDKKKTQVMSAKKKTTKTATKTKANSVKKKENKKTKATKASSKVNKGKTSDSTKITKKSPSKKSNKKSSAISKKKSSSKKPAKISVRKKKSASVSKKTNGNITKIKVVGVGGCGGNIATRLFDEFPRGVDVIVVNTDLQDLAHCRANKKLYIGKHTTRGLGAGMDPEIGRKSAEENREEISQALSGADMIFITSGFGGGTGSGAAPIVAEIAKEMGILTIGVVTKPFYFEGALRSQIAQDAVERMRERVDTLIEISNDKIFSIINPNTSVNKAFAAIDEILKNAVVGVAELILTPGMINVDFADIKYVMQHSGPAMIGVGIGSGKNRAVIAANNAINSPLLETSIEGARGLLFSVSGRKDLKMSEVNEIAKIVSENLNPSARIIFGTYYDRKVNKGQIKVTLIATGFSTSSYSKNRSLFGDFEKLSLYDIIDENKDDVADREEMKKVDDVGMEDLNDEGKCNEKDNFDDDSFWDIPTFLRRKKGK